MTYREMIILLEGLVLEISLEPNLDEYIEEAKLCAIMDILKPTLTRRKRND